MTFKNPLRILVLSFVFAIAAPLAGIAPGIVGISAAQAQTVSAISVTGNDRVDDATVRSYLTIQIGDVATGAAIQSSIASLNATGLFSTVSVRFASGTLFVAVSENLVVASVLFEGNRRFDDADLVAMVNLASSGTFSEARLAADIRSIELAYEQAGYTGVSVTSTTELTDSGRVRVRFFINEGERSGIAAINFTGNNSFHAAVLKDQIETKESHFLSWLFLDDEFSEAQLERDKATLRRFYADRGFPDVRILSAVAEFDASQNAYFISFAIDEGERYFFGDVDIQTSIAGLNVDALRGYIRTPAGAEYSQADLQKTVEDVAFRAAGQGFSFAEVRPRLERDVANKTFRVTYLVDEGARVYVERINIIGNTKTRDFVIRRELEFAEGDPFSRALAARGKSNIEALGYFKSVQMNVVQGSSADKVIITIAVIESATGEYGAMVGYDTASGVLGELSLTERNFLGRGQYLRVAIGASQAGQTFDFSFTEPHFMGTNLSAGIDVFKSVLEETSISFYGNDTTGARIRLGAPITEQLSATVFTGMSMSQYADANPTDSDIVTDGSVAFRGTVGYALNFENIDDPMRPRNGFVAELKQTYTFLTHNYLKTEARARYLVEIMRDSGIVASVRAQGGIINDFSGAGLSGTETFNLGPRLIRGFGPRGYGPMGANGEAYGTMMFAGLSGELEFPIPVLPDSYGLRGAVWADAAWIGDTTTLLVPTATSTENPLRTSAGVSLIWDSPFGPLRGDYALLVNGNTDDTVQRFQFTISTLL